MNFQWSREQKWNRVRVAQCVFALSEGSKLWHQLEDENNKGVLQKTYWYSRAHFGDLITADDKVLSEESESRNNHRCAEVVQDLAT